MCSRSQSYLTGGGILCSSSNPISQEGGGIVVFFSANHISQKEGFCVLLANPIAKGGILLVLLSHFYIIGEINVMFLYLFQNFT